jgi:hypothetical protein
MDTTLITIDPSSAPTNASAVNFGGKPPIVKFTPTLSDRNATSSSSSALSTSENRPTVRSVIGNDSALRIGFT